jgi:hypothetical protein
LGVLLMQVQTAGRTHDVAAQVHVAAVRFAIAAAAPAAAAVCVVLAAWVGAVVVEFLMAKQVPLVDLFVLLQLHVKPGLQEGLQEHGGVGPGATLVGFEVLVLDACLTNGGMMQSGFPV